MIEFEIVGRPAYRWNLADGAPKPFSVIAATVERWIAENPELPRIIRIVGINAEPIELSVNELLTQAYLFDGENPH